MISLSDRLPRAYEAIADRLLSDITEGRLKTGDAIPSERELTTSFGVGRSSVREALRMLESRGVIAPGRGKTFAVADPGNVLARALDVVFVADDATFDDLFELRLVLECEAAALAASRRTEEHLASMHEVLQAMERAIKAGSSEAFQRSDTEMHRLVGAAAANPFVLRTVEAARELMNRALGSLFLLPNRPERTLEQLRALLRALEAQRPEEAHGEMRRHVESVWRDVAKLVMRG
jgi:GntR family transcriptional repressor for pyruvate dehydrogenase complex